jgi:hypothetical protein
MIHRCVAPLYGSNRQASKTNNNKTSSFNSSSKAQKVIPRQGIKIKLSPFRGLGFQIRSSAWLEHYTDNVGVSSSNLLGSTLVS